MADLSWLSNEAHNFHRMFEGAFYVLVTIFLLLGIILELLKVPMAGQVEIGTLVGRALIAILLLYTFTDVINLLSDLMDGLTKILGAQNNFDLIRAKMADKWKKEFSWSWMELSRSLTMLISYVAFVLFHLSFYLANAFILFTWTMLYVFSPVLIALFVLPQTSRATGALYRSLIEVSCWKPVWSVLATLLWSIGLSDIATNTETSNVLTVLSYTLVFAGALLMTPLIVHALAGAGFSAMISTVGAIGLGPVAISPAVLGKKWLGIGAETSKVMYNVGHTGATRVTEKYFPRVNRYVRAMPRFNTSSRRPIFEESPQSPASKPASTSTPPKK
jgi:hypothetical protein